MVSGAWEVADTLFVTLDFAEEAKDSYILFDCPGQVELFTHHETLPRIFHKIEKLGYRVRLYSFPLLVTLIFNTDFVSASRDTPTRFTHLEPTNALHLLPAPLSTKHASHAVPTRKRSDQD